MSAILNDAFYITKSHLEVLSNQGDAFEIFSIHKCDKAFSLFFLFLNRLLHSFYSSSSFFAQRLVGGFFSIRAFYLRDMDCNIDDFLNKGLYYTQGNVFFFSCLNPTIDFVNVKQKCATWNI